MNSFYGSSFQQPPFSLQSRALCQMLQNFGHHASDEAVEFVEQFYVDFFRDADFENEDNSENEEDLMKLYEMYGARTPRPPTPARLGSKASEKDTVYQLSEDIIRGRLLQRVLPVKVSYATN
ncbi:hypothetical protein F5887DRAFT_1075640 [Amanita rubescens]|nr:hypothetical protein F5887DRAFT_1075640 [Amanita rubescens]